MPESQIRRILNQIKWDSDKNISDYEISFLHRGAINDLKTYPADKIKEIKISYLLFIDETEDEGEVLIPFHRIRKIFNKRTNEIIWKNVQTRD
ncbi:MAG TPA: RNA repair domain-containing protein [Candidatus Deferrimicrobium sp.]|nr:RNA repair domain-containing protein [Candidatus Deferrimicrobium sp.]